MTSKSAVHHALAQLATQRDDAWHNLVECGPDALPDIVDAFARARDADRKIALITVVSEYRSQRALPFLSELLDSADAPVWKCALDGLVTLGGEPAREVLRNAIAAAPDDRREWIAEALEQIRGLN
jgi:hypothetical protein